MHGSASKIKAAYLPGAQFSRRGCPTWSRASGAGGTAKVCANWAFVSGVPPVSPYLKLIERIQKKKVGDGRKGISPCQAPCAETGGTGGTGAKVAGVSGETAGAGHRWDSWDAPALGEGAKVPRFKDARTQGRDA